MKGVYLIFIEMEDTKLEIGALGEIEFGEGIYVYTGSARRSLESRLERHFSTEKNLHWHIDYLTAGGENVDYFILPEKSSYECLLASKLSEICKEIEGFGCSDCDCSSHLFRIPEGLTG